MRSRHFVNQVVGTQQPQLAGDDSAAAAFFFGVDFLFVAEDQLAQVAVAHAVDGDLSAADGFQQFLIDRVKRAQRTRWFAFEPGGFADRFEQFSQFGVLFHGGHRLDVSLVGCAAHLGAAVQVGDAFAQGLPGMLAGLVSVAVDPAAALHGAVDFRVASVVMP